MSTVRRRAWAYTAAQGALAISRPTEIPTEVRTLLGPAGILLWGSASGRILLGRMLGMMPDGAWPAPLGDLERMLRRARFHAAPMLSARAVERALAIAWGRPPT